MPSDTDADDVSLSDDISSSDDVSNDVNSSDDVGDDANSSDDVSDEETNSSDGATSTDDDLSADSSSASSRAPSADKDVTMFRQSANFMLKLSELIYNHALEVSVKRSIHGHPGVKQAARTIAVRRYIVAPPSSDDFIANRTRPS